MSIRTIIEINHDYLYNWQKHPEDAAKLLWKVLTDSGRLVETHDQSLFGVRVIAQRHHADELTVKIT